MNLNVEGGDMDVMASPTRDNKQKSNLPSTSSPAKELSKSTSDVTQSQSRDRRYSFSSEDILALEMQVRRQSSGHHLTTVRSGSFHGSSPPSRQNSQPSSPRSTMRSGSFNEAKVRSPRENEVPSLVPVKTIYNNTPLNDKLLNRRRSSMSVVNIDLNTLIVPEKKTGFAALCECFPMSWSHSDHQKYKIDENSQAYNEALEQQDSKYRERRLRGGSKDVGTKDSDSSKETHNENIRDDDGMTDAVNFESTFSNTEALTAFESRTPKKGVKDKDAKMASLSDSVNQTGKENGTGDRKKVPYASHNNDNDNDNDNDNAAWGRGSHDAGNDLKRAPTLRRRPKVDKEGNIVTEHDSGGHPWIIYPDSRFFHFQKSLVVYLTFLTALFLPPLMAFDLLDLTYVLVTNWIIDIIFVVNIGFFFITAIPIEGGGYITSFTIIRQNLLVSKGFYMDCVASIPWELVAVISYSQNAKSMSILRMLRLLRLKNFSITNSQTNLGMLLRQILVLLLLAHFCGCAWWGLAFAQDFPQSTFFMIGDNFIGEWHRKTRNSLLDFITNYFRCLFWGMSAMCSFTANLKPDIASDCVLCIGIATIGVVVFAYVVGTIFDVMSTICAKSQSYREYVEEINRWLKYRKLPDELEIRVKEYHRLQFHLLKGVDEGRLLRDLPDTLSREITSTTRSQMLMQNKLFKNLSPGFVGSICHLMEVQVCLSNEVIVNAGEQANQMYIISRGMVEVCTSEGTTVATLGVGDIFGEIALLLKRPRTASVWTISVCELFTISASDLADVVDIYEEFKDLLMGYAKGRLFKLKKIEQEEEQAFAQTIVSSSSVADFNPLQPPTAESMTDPTSNAPRNISSTDLDSKAVKESATGLFDYVAPPDVFLGGACGCTTWRKEIAVPLLEAGGVTYYNPQVEDWSPDLMAAEMYAKKHCKVLLFVINDETRGVASMIEAAALMKKNLATDSYKMDGQRSMHQDMVLVLQDIDASQNVEGDKLNPKEIKDLNRGRMFLKDLADAGDDVHLFTNITNAVQFLVEMRREKRRQGTIYM